MFFAQELPYLFLANSKLVLANDIVYRALFLNY